MKIRRQTAIVPAINMRYVREAVSGSTDAKAVTITVYGLSLLVFGARDGSITILFPTVGANGVTHDLRVDGPTKRNRFNVKGRWIQIGRGATKAAKGALNPWEELVRILDITSEVNRRKLSTVVNLLQSKQIQAALTIRGATLQPAFPVSAVGQATMWSYQRQEHLFTDSATFQLGASKHFLTVTDLKGNVTKVPCPRKLLFANIDPTLGPVKPDCRRLGETRGYYRLFGLKTSEGEIPRATVGLGADYKIKVKSGPQGCNCNLGRVMVRGWKP